MQFNKSKFALLLAVLGLVFGLSACDKDGDSSDSNSSTTESSAQPVGLFAGDKAIDGVMQFGNRVAKTGKANVLGLAFACNSDLTSVKFGDLSKGDDNKMMATASIDDYGVEAMVTADGRRLKFAFKGDNVGELSSKVPVVILTPADKATDDGFTGFNDLVIGLEPANIVDGFIALDFGPVEKFDKITLCVVPK